MAASVKCQLTLCPLSSSLLSTLQGSYLIESEMLTESGLTRLAASAQPSAVALRISSLGAQT